MQQMLIAKDVTYFADNIKILYLERLLVGGRNSTKQPDETKCTAGREPEDSHKCENQ